MSVKVGRRQGDTNRRGLTASNGWHDLRSLDWGHGWVNGDDLDLEAAIVAGAAAGWSAGAWSKAARLTLRENAGDTGKDEGGRCERVLHFGGR